MQYQIMQCMHSKNKFVLKFMLFNSYMYVSMHLNSIFLTKFFEKTQRSTICVSHYVLKCTVCGGEVTPPLKYDNMWSNAPLQGRLLLQLFIPHCSFKILNSYL